LDLEDRAAFDLKDIDQPVERETAWNQNYNSNWDDNVDVDHDWSQLN
jgi:hypothetical protein